MFKSKTNHNNFGTESVPNPLPIGHLFMGNYAIANLWWLMCIGDIVLYDQLLKKKGTFVHIIAPEPSERGTVQPPIWPEIGKMISNILSCATSGRAS